MKTVSRHVGFTLALALCGAAPASAEIPTTFRPPVLNPLPPRDIGPLFPVAPCGPSTENAIFEEFAFTVASDYFSASFVPADFFPTITYGTPENPIKQNGQQYYAKIDVKDAYYWYWRGVYDAIRSAHSCAIDPATAFLRLLWVTH